MRITKREYDRLWGMKNPGCWRVERGGRWYYHCDPEQAQRCADAMYEHESLHHLHRAAKGPEWDNLATDDLINRHIKRSKPNYIELTTGLRKGMTVPVVSESERSVRAALPDGTTIVVPKGSAGGLTYYRDAVVVDADLYVPIERG